MKLLLLFFLAGIPVTQATFIGGASIDSAIEDAIQKEEIPGAVVLIGHKGKVIHYKAYGYRALEPVEERMTLDTIFDLASLTKVVATTSCIMKLVEEGKVRLGDRVIQYLPEYQAGQSDITVRQLLTHYSGLRPDVDLEPEWSGYETGIQKALIDRPRSLPDTRFVYSDINFILLGEIVRRVSGKTLPEYATEEIFEPLGMKETMFQPPFSLSHRIAPTEIVEPGEPPLRGIVHDPTTRFMGGVAGHAGLFSTATDLAKFAEMMLGLGSLDGIRVFSPLTVRQFTSPQSPEGLPVRGFGWDIDSPFSGNRGDLFPVGSYGHTGFTGTSMWIDPMTETYVILLTNSGHPHLRKPVTSLRGRVANATAAGLVVKIPEMAMSFFGRTFTAPDRSQPRNAEVLTGLDVLARENFARLKNKRVGVITNHTGVSRDGQRNVDLMQAAGVNLKAIYSPEHGITGKADHQNIGHGRDAKTGLPVWSLYSGANRRPTAEMLRNIDVLVFDIQDVGTRFYTYTCTMAYAMEEAAKRKISFVVLDRPNPITGEHVEGPMLDPDLDTFVGCYPMPLRHGMTIGEIAMMINNDLEPKAELEVIKMENWERGDWFDSTGLTWINPSPNMRSLNAALLYPGIGMLEYSTMYSVGRGTDAPFEQIGADWIRGPELATYLNERSVPGIRVYPTRFEPKESNFKGEMIEGVRFVITDRDEFNSSRFGMELGVALSTLFPGRINWSANLNLVGSKEALKTMESGQVYNPDSLDVDEFKLKRRDFLLY
ncbi:MAG: exo-beta-N-acetylmuramidase NamZ domain-containing protein [Bryobacteraceae bacterium]